MLAMPRRSPPPLPSREVLLGHVQQMNDHLAQLRKRLYPILSQWRLHNLTRDDNFYGFARLDLLQEELKQLSALLGEPVDE